MRLASFKMYVSPPPLAQATAELWHYLQARLRRDGIAGVPEGLDDNMAHDAAWLRPELLIAQTCGYPFVNRLRGKTKLVATPVYGHPGCDGATMCSFIIIRKNFPAQSLEDLRGVRAAINSRDSNSGMNLLRAAIAPLARDGRFFAEVIETGSHSGSIAAVAEGKADAAAIDCVTYANIQRFDAAQLDAIRVLAETPSGPGLPMITSIETSDGDVVQLRTALQDAIAEPALSAVREVLGLVDFVTLSQEDYEVLSTIAEGARRYGYLDFDSTQ